MATIHRRKALKLLASLALGSASWAQVQSSPKRVHIAIVGGGAGGIAILSKLSRMAPNAKITLITPNEIQIYQPGQLFMAAGLARGSEMRKPTRDFLPPGIQWIRAKVAEFDPKHNRLLTDEGKELFYDLLVVAVGTSYHYQRIEGLSRELVGRGSIASVYLNDPESGGLQGGTTTWKWLTAIHQRLTSNPSKPVRLLLTHPSTPIKCIGAPWSILYLASHLFQGGGPLPKTKGKIEVTHIGPSPLWQRSPYRQALEAVQEKYPNIEVLPDYELIALTPERAIVAGQGGERELPYDFIHITPPMSGANELRHSPLAGEREAKEWMEVDPKTLQHRRYPNIFGIGDVVATPGGKSAWTILYQSRVVAANIVAQMEGRPLPAQFDGTTLSPIKTGYSQAMVAAFDYEDPVKELPLDPLKPSRIWWWLDRYLAKPIYWNFLLRGLI
ncbi:MAG: NAD(P)/FAD-dependent oxidoreductase [Nitratiruptor sp.]|nr:NAD(P)/FAD-dependent oxidoreductase [Nitratiruptor sp.]NPA83426.1 NAD(P)/FAD-dependent oxidoreductase [Campylobacterota bacterium]